MLMLWQRRALRAWLLLLLPLAAFFCYRAVSAHLEAETAQEYATRWYQQDLEDDRAGIPKGKFSIDPKEELHRSNKWKYAALARRDDSILVAVILLVLPLAGIVGFRAGRWIWRGRTEDITSAPSSDPK